MKLWHQMWTSISKIIKKIILLYKTFLGELCTRVLCLHHPHSSLTPQTVLMAPPFKIHDLLVIIFTCVYVCVYICVYMNTWLYNILNMFTAACMFMCSEFTTWDWANCVGIHPWRKLILYLSAAIDHCVGFPLFMLKH